MAFSKQEYWSGLPFPGPGDLPNPGIKSVSPMSPALQADSLPDKPLGKFWIINYQTMNCFLLVEFVLFLFLSLFLLHSLILMDHFIWYIFFLLWVHQLYFLVSISFPRLKLILVILTLLSDNPKICILSESGFYHNFVSPNCFKNKQNKKHIFFSCFVKFFINLCGF